MHRPIVIVDPLSSGVELAPAFNARGVPAIAVTLKNLDLELGFGTRMQRSNFIKIIPNQDNITNILREYNPIAIIPGTEEGVSVAENITQILTPEFANDPKKSCHRLHKAFMQKALEDAGVPFLKTINASSEKEVEVWIKENNLSNIPLIAKPPISAGSDKVFHISAGEQWRKAFRRILNEPTKITGSKSNTVVMQEQAIGIEFAIGTVSINGEHYLSHLIQYNKNSSEGRKTVFDYVEFIPFCKKTHGELFDYTKEALNALGIKWGAAHNEIMLTSNGPRLIESGARMLGGPTVEFSRVATGSCQADKLVEIFTDGRLKQKQYQFKKTVVPVFLNAHKEGMISNLEVFDEALALPTLLNKFIWPKNGDNVPQTVDYLTSIGIIALAGNRESIFADYKKIRNLESKLVIV